MNRSCSGLGFGFIGEKLGADAVPDLVFRIAPHQNIRLIALSAEIGYRFMSVFCIAESPYLHGVRHDGAALLLHTVMARSLWRLPISGMNEKLVGKADRSCHTLWLTRCGLLGLIRPGLCRRRRQVWRRLPHLLLPACPRTFCFLGSDRIGRHFGVKCLRRT